MAAEAAQRERRLWLALGASAVMHCVTLLLVVAALAGQGRAPLPAGDALGRRSGRSLLQVCGLRWVVGAGMGERSGLAPGDVADAPAGAPPPTLAGPSLCACTGSQAHGSGPAVPADRG